MDDKESTEKTVRCHRAQCNTAMVVEQDITAVFVKVAVRRDENIYNKFDTYEHGVGHVEVSSKEVSSKAHWTHMRKEFKELPPMIATASLQVTVTAKWSQIIEYQLD